MLYIYRIPLGILTVVHMEIQTYKSYTLEPCMEALMNDTSCIIGNAGYREFGACPKLGTKSQCTSASGASILIIHFMYN